MNAYSPKTKRLAIAALLALSVMSPFSAKATSAAADSAEMLVKDKLVEPLRQKEEKRSKFSRAIVPPQSRRVRILEETARTDARGQAFLAFAIDESHALPTPEAEDNWRQDAITGCVYPKSGEILIKRGDVYYPSSVLWGKSGSQAPKTVCQAK